mgnify:CR=1 FL=1
MLLLEPLRLGLHLGRLSAPGHERGGIGVHIKSRKSHHIHIKSIHPHGSVVFAIFGLGGKEIVINILIT